MLSNIGLTIPNFGSVLYHLCFPDQTLLADNFTEHDACNWVLFLDAIKKILQNILENPGFARYRRLNMSSNVFRRVLASRMGLQILEAMGWERLEAHDVLVLDESISLLIVRARLAEFEAAIQTLYEITNKFSNICRDQSTDDFVSSIKEKTQNLNFVKTEQVGSQDTEGGRNSLRTVSPTTAISLRHAIKEEIRKQQGESDLCENNLRGIQQHTSSPEPEDSFEKKLEQRLLARMRANIN